MIALQHRPITIRSIRTRPPQAVTIDPDMSYYIGKSIILFVGFYSGLQWLHYRELRKKKQNKDQQ
jgi:hypothetical protein